MNTAEVKFIKSFAINYTKGIKYQFHPIRKIDEWWYTAVVDNLTRIRNTCNAVICGDEDGDSLKAPMFVMQVYKKNKINESILCDDDPKAYEVLSRKANATIKQLLDGYNSDTDERIKTFRKNSVVIRTSDLHYDNAMYDKFFTVSIDNNYFSQFYHYMKDACDVLLNFLKEYKYKITSEKGWNNFDDAVMLNYENFHDFVIEKFSKYQDVDFLAMQDGIRSSYLLTKNQQEISIMLYKKLKMHVMYQYNQGEINTIKHEMCALIDSTDANAYVLTEENKDARLVGHISVLENYFNTHIGDVVFTDRMVLAHHYRSEFITINTESLNTEFTFDKSEMGFLIHDFADSKDSPNNCIRTALMMCVNDPYLGYSISNMENIHYLLKHGEFKESGFPKSEDDNEDDEISMDLTKLGKKSKDDALSSYQEFKDKLKGPIYDDENIEDLAKKLIDDISSIFSDKKITIPQNISTYSTPINTGNYSTKGLGRLLKDVKEEDKKQNDMMDYMITIIENIGEAIQNHGIIGDFSDFIELSKVCKESLNNKRIPLINNFAQYSSIKNNIVLQCAGVLSKNKFVMIAIVNNGNEYMMYKLSDTIISTIIGEQLETYIKKSSDYPIFILGNSDVAIGLKAETTILSNTIWKDIKEFSYDLIRLLEGALMWLHIICTNFPEYNKTHNITLTNPSFTNLLDVIENNSLFNDIDDIKSILYAFEQDDSRPSIDHNILITTPSGKHISINENGYNPQFIIGKGMFDFSTQFRLMIQDASLVIPSCSYTSSDEFESDLIKIFKYMKYVKESENEKPKKKNNKNKKHDIESDEFII